MLPILPFLLALTLTVNCSPSSGGGRRRGMTARDPSISSSALGQAFGRPDPAKASDHYIRYFAQTDHSGQVFSSQVQDLPDDFSSPYLTRDQRNAIVDQHLSRYDIPVLLPNTDQFYSMRMMDKYGPEDYMGHPDNDAILRRHFDQVYPIHGGQSLQEQQRVMRDLELAKKSLEAAQKAMRYLNSQPSACVIHEPSGLLYASPKKDIRNHKLLMHDIDAQYKRGMFPKLRHDDRIHFKKSDDKKYSNRITWRSQTTKGMTEETSSEDEY